MDLTVISAQYEFSHHALYNPDEDKIKNLGSHGLLLRVTPNQDHKIRFDDGMIFCSAQTAVSEASSSRYITEANLWILRVEEDDIRLTAGRVMRYCTEVGETSKDMKLINIFHPLIRSDFEIVRQFLLQRTFPNSINLLLRNFDDCDVISLDANSNTIDWRRSAGNEIDVPSIAFTFY